MYRHLVQLLIQKQLAKKLVSTSIVASQYRKLTSSNHIDAVAQYLKSGARLGVEVFDELLHYGLNLLLPVYKKFVLNNKYNVLVHKHLEIMNEIYDVYATVIQCQFRRFHAINVVAKVRNEFTEARTTAEIAANKKKKHRSRDEDT